MSCLECELPYLLEVSRPPDPELVDLIEQAFIEGQIDSHEADLAYMWLIAAGEQGRAQMADLSLVPILSHGVLNIRQKQAGLGYVTA
jgi:hypothetical protein